MTACAECGYEHICHVQVQEADALRETIAELRESRDNAYALLDRCGRRQAELTDENLQLTSQLNQLMLGGAR